MPRGSLDDVESTPLLGQRDEHDASDTDLTAAPSARWTGFTAWLTIKKPRTIVFVISVVKFLITLSGTMIMLPIFRLMEDAFCHQYYEDDSRDMIDEKRCKVDGVQRQLAYLGGIFAMVSAVVALLVAVPYGILADRVGRKPTFLLSYTGIVCSFVYGPLLLWFGHSLNLYLMLSGVLWFFVGGGVPVAMGVLYAMAADVSAEAERAATFLYLALGASAGGFLGPLVAGKLMESYGPWVPIMTVYAITPPLYVLILMLPETLKIEPGNADQDDVPLLLAMRRHVLEAAKELRTSFALLANVNIILTMSAFFIQSPLIVAYSSILAQYVSKNFGWTLAQTSYLLSPLSLLHLVILGILPKVSEILVSPNRFFRLSSFGKDVRLAQLSFGILIIAALLEGFSRGIALFLVGLFVGTFGSATSPLSRAIITAHVEAKRTSRLYALISAVETVGALFGGPVLAWCFDMGMQKKGLWMGLPWFYVATLCTAVLVALSFVKEPPKLEFAAADHSGEPDAPLDVEI